MKLIQEQCGLFSRFLSGHVLQHFGQAGTGVATAGTPDTQLKVFIYITFLEKLKQPIGYNLLEGFRQEEEVGYWAVVAKNSMSRVFFFRRGLITASLKDCGAYPDDNDRLIAFSKELLIKGRIYWSNFVGMGSKIQVMGLDDEIVGSWSRVIREKLSK